MTQEQEQEQEDRIGTGAPEPDAREFAPDAAPSPVPAADSGQPRKRRISTGRLFTAAVTIGVLGGVGTGYAVQASRPPTPLPPLAATQPSYLPVGVYQGIAPTPLPASQDDATLTEGDLSSLLLPTPAGASTTDIDWVDQDLSIEDEADTCQNPAGCFTTDLSDGIDGSADTGWVTANGFGVEIRMLRYAPGHSDQARMNIQDGADTGDGRTAIPMPTGIDATGFEYLDSNGANDDHAFAVHGDIEVLFWVTSATRVPDPSLIDSVIKQQMGRL
jgi:hypothetical protein